MVKDRTLLQRLIYTNRTAQDDSLPLLHRVAPLAVYGGAPISFTLRGHNLQQVEEQVVCRSQGQHFYPCTEFLPAEQLPLQGAAACPTGHHLASKDSVRSSGTPRLAASDSVRSSRLGGGEPSLGKSRGSALVGPFPPSQRHSLLEGVRCQLPPLPGCRLLQVEVCKRGFLSRCRPLLVVDDPVLAAEVNTLLERQQVPMNHKQREALLHDLAAVLAFAAGTAGAAAVPASVVVQKARRLLVLACDLGWPAVAARVLPVALSGAANATEAVAAVENLVEGQEELTLLHRAVRSGSLPLVKGIMAWGEQNQYQWPVDKGGPYGLTPLHLAAMLDDDGVIALRLMDTCGPQAFTSACSDDGVTPFHLAFQMGHFVVDRVLQLMKDPDNLHVLEQHTLARHQLLVKQEQEEAEQPARCITRESNCLDACLACQSTVPPLLLSIMAHCARCGAQRPCLQALEKEREARKLEAEQGSGRQQAHAGHGAGESSRARRAAARARAEASSGADGKGEQAEACGESGCQGGSSCEHRSSSSCSHVTKAVYEITAICQICHSNRVMTVN